MAEKFLDTHRMISDQQRRIAIALDVGLKALRPILQFSAWEQNRIRLAAERPHAKGDGSFESPSGLRPSTCGGRWTRPTD